MMPQSNTRDADRALAETVEKALKDQSELARFDIEVVVDGGDVCLRGRVDELEQRSLVARVATAVEGVRNVHNEVVAGLQATEETDPERACEE